MRRTTTLFGFGLTVVAYLALGAGCSDKGGAGSGARDGAGAKKVEKSGDQPYPLTTCLLSGKDLNAKSSMQTVVHKGQQMKFCCKKCLGKFQEDPETYIKKLAEAGEGSP